MEIAHFCLKLQSSGRVALYHDLQPPHSPAFFETSEILFLAYVSLKIFLGMGVNLAHVSKAQGFAGRASNSCRLWH